MLLQLAELPIHLPLSIVLDPPEMDAVEVAVDVEADMSITPEPEPLQVEQQQFEQAVDEYEPPHKYDDEDDHLIDDKAAQWRASLGRQTWFFLHTLAAKYVVCFPRVSVLLCYVIPLPSNPLSLSTRYPDYPSEVDQRTVRNLVAALGQLYPCKLCRRHLREKLQRPSLGPVATENRTALSVWFCRLHNMVRHSLKQVDVRPNPLPPLVRSMLIRGSHFTAATPSS